MQDNQKYIAALDLIERRHASEVSRIVQNGIVLAKFSGDDVGAEYLRANMIPMGIAHRVLASKQRRSGDWK